MKYAKMPILVCTRCGHTWTARSKELPLRCAKCKSPYWNRERGAK